VLHTSVTQVIEYVLGGEAGPALQAHLVTSRDAGGAGEGGGVGLLEVILDSHSRRVEENDKSVRVTQEAAAAGSWEGLEPCSFGVGKRYAPAGGADGALISWANAIGVFL
jgi:hypothetical protein